MKDYNVEDRLITKEDWENWLKSKEEYSDKRLSNMPETPTKKETKYAVIEWHKYPQEKPKEDKSTYCPSICGVKVSLILLLGLLQRMFSKIFGTNVYMPGQRCLPHIRSKRMTKAELIKALEGLPDDTRIYVPSVEVAGDIMLASYVQVDYVGDGSIVKVLIIGDREALKRQI